MTRDEVVRHLDGMVGPPDGLTDDLVIEFVQETESATGVLDESCWEGMTLEGVLEAYWAYASRWHPPASN